MLSVLSIAKIQVSAANYVDGRFVLNASATDTILKQTRFGLADFGLLWSKDLKIADMGFLGSKNVKVNGSQISFTLCLSKTDEEGFKGNDSTKVKEIVVKVILTDKVDNKTIRREVYTSLIPKKVFTMRKDFTVSEALKLMRCTNDFDKGFFDYKTYKVISYPSNDNIVKPSSTFKSLVNAKDEYGVQGLIDEYERDYPDTQVNYYHNPLEAPDSYNEWIVVFIAVDEAHRP